MKKIEPINIMDKFSLFNEKWTPKIIGELNNQYVKLCKLKDDFVWHSHKNEDELFMVFKGTLLMEFRDGRPDDYVSLSTENDYIDHDEEDNEWAEWRDLIKQIVTE